MTSTAAHGWHGKLRSGVLALALTFSSAGIGMVAAPAAHAIDQSKGTAGYCPNASGVTVVIDFRELGGSTIIRCAPGSQATGLAALKAAGIKITGTNRWGESFICRIEGKPGPKSEPCIDTPPASAYWSYWHAPNKGTWTYSQWGVANRKPPPGSFEGWSFSKNKTSTTNPPPRIAPTRPAAVKPVDSSSSEGSSTGGSSTTTGGGSASGGSASGGSSDGGSSTNGGTGGGTGIPPEAVSTPGADAPGAPTSTDAPQNAAPSGTAQPEASSSPSASASDRPLPGTQAQPSEAPGWTGVGEEGTQNVDLAANDGMPTSTLLGIVAATALAAAAGVTAWRRRRTAGEPGDTP